MIGLSEKKPFSIILFIAVLFVLWIAIAFALHQVFNGQMIGIDYMFYWHAGQVFFLEQGDIYSPAIGDQNQLWVYGRAALPGEDHLNFAYPPYILFLPFPLFFFDYEWSQPLWMSANLLCVLGMGLFFFPQAPKWLPITLLLFYPVYFTLIIGNTALMIGILLIVTFHILLNQPDYSPRTGFLIGFLLAFSTGKPQMVWLSLLFIFFICIFQKRLHLIYGFLTAFLLINVVSFVIYPSWPINWIRNSLLYSQEGGILPTFVWYLRVFVPENIAVGGYGVMLLVLIPFLGWLFWRWKRDQIDSLTLLVIIAGISNLFDPSSLTPDKILLLVPLFLWAIRNPSSNAVKVVWSLGIFLTNLAFFLGQSTQYKFAVDTLPLLFYIAWMVYFLVSQKWQTPKTDMSLQSG